MTKTAKKTTTKKAKEGLKLTNLEKVYFPELGFTKGDVIAYYDKMADVMLPYLLHRPLSLNRHPGGIHKPSFYQKNIDYEVPSFIETHERFSDSNNENINYMVCNNKETLLYMANLGCIEINPWNSRAEKEEYPDWMVIDLDPGDNTFDQVVTVAQAVKRLLDLSCEKSWVKTSGKTGLHIYVPLGARYDYEQVKNFCHLLMTLVHNELPEITSLERSPAKRTKLIYLDYLQNRVGQTIAAPYSLRPTEEASVSTPLLWSEVKKGLDPKKFTIKTIDKRLKRHGDLFASMLKEKVDLKKAIKCLEAEMKNNNLTV
jgi:bifunctional non-homologous end joining protein LigD